MIGIIILLMEVFFHQYLIYLHVLFFSVQILSPISGITAILSDLAISLISGIITAIVLISYTYNKEKELDSNEILSALYSEIKFNRDQILKFPKEAERIYNYWKVLGWKELADLNWDLFLSEFEGRDSQQVTVFEFYERPWFNKNRVVHYSTDTQNKLFYRYLSYEAFSVFLQQGMQLNLKGNSLKSSEPQIKKILYEYYESCNRYCIETQKIIDEMSTLIEKISEPLHYSNSRRCPISEIPANIELEMEYDMTKKESQVLMIFHDQDWIFTDISIKSLLVEPGVHEYPNFIIAQNNNLLNVHGYYMHKIFEQQKILLPFDQNGGPIDFEAWKNYILSVRHQNRMTFTYLFNFIKKAL